METRSNHILVGGVVLALLVAVLAFIIWLSQMMKPRRATTSASTTPPTRIWFERVSISAQLLS